MGKGVRKGQDRCCDRLAPHAFLHSPESGKPKWKPDSSGVQEDVETHADLTEFVCKWMEQMGIS